MGIHDDGKKVSGNLLPRKKSNSIQSDCEIQGPKNKKDKELKNQGNNDSSSQVNNTNTESLEVYSAQNIATVPANNPKKSKNQNITKTQSQA